MIDLQIFNNEINAHFCGGKGRNLFRDKKGKSVK
jgi:hypothetical protein